MQNGQEQPQNKITFAVFFFRFFVTFLLLAKFDGCAEHLVAL